MPTTIADVADHYNITSSVSCDPPRASSALEACGPYSDSRSKKLNPCRSSNSGVKLPTQLFQSPFLAPFSRGHCEMEKPPARWRHVGLLLCPSADGHPPGLRFPQETNRTAKFLGSPTKRQPLALASRPHSPFSCPARNGRRKGEKTNERANQTDQSRSI